MNPTDTLNSIHAALCHPYDWSAETLDVIATILTAAGYTFPNEDEVAELNPDDDNAFSKYRPAN